MRKAIVNIRCITYNHGQYIRRCLEGFVMQKTNFHFEAIIHDDASTDNTAEIIREFAERYPSIIIPVFEKENQYRKGTLSRIMDNLCSAQYVAICEGDDYWTDPYKLQKQVDFMEEHPDVAFTYHNALSECGEKKRVFISLNKQSHYVDLAELLDCWAIPTASVLFRNSAYVVPKEYPSFINGDYATELLLKSRGSVYYDSSIMSVYRIHDESVSSMLNKNPISMYSRIIELLRYFKTLYPGEGDKLLFENAIERYTDRISEIKRIQKYPILKLFNKHFYKRLLFEKLRIQRIS